MNSNLYTPVIYSEVKLNLYDEYQPRKAMICGLSLIVSNHHTLNELYHQVEPPSGWLDASTFVSLTSSNAAHYLGLYPNKGCLYPGSDADLICWPYDNIINCTIQHPSLVIHHGKLIVYNGNLIEDISNNSNDLKIIPCNHLNEIQSNQPLGMLQTGKLFPSTIYDLVNAFERVSV
ncbi:unnamed protein product [Schistosoma mattheei]|uniref:dihydropyrimidinase n=1 Tax=Schistosoma mattheei TaxID=31246 RepID=A0A183NMC5_9TREM|nr:unnamed protein product [Schistosoma mattheei]